MSQTEEADPIFDAPEKPFKIQSGELQDGATDVAAALGLTEQTTEVENQDGSKEQKKSDEEGQKLVDRNSAKIQETAELLYIQEERLSLGTDGYLQKLLDSKDTHDRKMAEKVLKRNAEHFGASSIEEYQLLKAKQQAGSDPTAQELVEQKFKVSRLEQKQQEADWNTWKKDNSVSGELSELADTIHTQYANMPNGDVVAMARGKMGIQNTSTSKQGATMAFGGSSPSESEDVMTSPLAKKLLKDPKGAVKFAREYFKN